MNIDEIKNSININKKKWKHIFTTNCYAYALGLDIRENSIMKNAYQPGIMGENYASVCNSDYFSYGLLLDCFYFDMRKLDIIVKEINPLDEIKADEWKIALFTSFYEYNGYTEMLSDYHFLRQMEDGYWYHKPGYLNKPTNKDSLGNLITSPNDCFIYGKEYKKTYSLRRN